MGATEEFRILKRNGDDLDSLFNDIFNKGKKLVEQINEFNQNKRINGRKYDSENSHITNNIIAFCGDRGTGKTTAMNEFAKGLEDFVKLPAIDPTLFTTNDSILEIIIARLFEGFDFENSKLDIEEQRIILKLFAKIYSQLKTINEEKEERFKKDFYEEENLETIVRLKGGLEIKDTLFEIVEEYLKVQKSEKNSLIIKIDDLDMNLEHAFNVIEEIRKNLLINNVIILISLNDIQLNRIISGKFNDAVGNMSGKLSSNYLTKLIPPQSRLYLPKLEKLIVSDEVIFQEIKELQDKELVENESIKETITKSIVEDVLKQIQQNQDVTLTKSKKTSDDKESVTSESIVDNILKLIYQKTHLIFLKNKYDFNTLIPTNLRELVQLKVFLEGLEEIDNDKFEAIYDKDTNEKLQKNLVLFRDYLLYERILTDLEDGEIEFLRSLPLMQANRLNKEINIYFSKLQENFEVEVEYIDNTEDESKNALSLAKVLYLMNAVRENNKKQLDQFIYYLKCIYSTILLENLLIAIREKGTSSLIGNLGKNIIGTYSKDKRGFEFEFYPRVDKNSEYISVRDVKITDISISEVGTLRDLLQNDYLLNEDTYFAHFIFLSFLSFGQYNGKNFFNTINANANVGVQNGVFRINNLIYHLLDYSRNFERIFNYKIEDIPNSGENNKMKEIFNRLSKKNTLLLFPIYSVDYIERINEFDFSSKGKINVDNFYEYILTNFLIQLFKCGKEIINSNKFLRNSNFLSLPLEFNRILKKGEIINILSNNLKSFLRNPSKLVTSEVRNIIENDISISYNSTIVNLLKQGFEISSIDKWENIANNLKKLQNDKYSEFIKNIENDIEIYKEVNTYLERVQNKDVEAQKEVYDLLNQRIYKRKLTLLKTYDNLVESNDN